MGTFNVTIEVAAGPDGPFESMEAMVDTGATFTVAPASILHRLGVEPTRRIRFISPTAAAWNATRVQSWSGSTRNRPLRSPCLARAMGTVLGSVTLATLGLGVDPERQRLIPAPAYLPGIGWSPTGARGSLSWAPSTSPSK